MKIRTQFLLNLFLFAALLIFVSLLLVFTDRQVNILNQQVAIARDMSLNARELSYLSNDYLLNHVTQQRERWDAKYNTLTQDLNALTLTDPEALDLIDKIKTSQSRLLAIFNETATTLDNPALVNDPAQELEVIRVSWSRLEVQNQGMVFDASLIEQNLVNQVDQMRRTNEILIFVLVGLFGVYLIIDTVVIYRRVLGALSDLEEGTRIIGSGNLDYRLRQPKRDEIGQLSQAFNRMAANLKDMTTSKAALEKEITERKKAEWLIHSYAQRLEQSNRELEGFAMVASHDLQEPLRKIEVFGGRLKESLGPSLNQDDQDYLDRMEKAIQRMQAMIEGLLSLSRVSSSGRPFKAVDLNDTMRTVLDDLGRRIHQTGGTVEVGNLPVIQADPVQMDQLFQNLIGNALKFHQPDVPPVVRVSFSPVGENEVEITVEDNGVGFSMEAASQLFQPFQRLHGRSEFEGSGIGLSICRKIVERHGGTIRAESEPGVGSRFVVRLMRG